MKKARSRSRGPSPNSRGLSGTPHDRSSTRTAPLGGAARRSSAIVTSPRNSMSLSSIRLRTTLPGRAHTSVTRCWTTPETGDAVLVAPQETLPPAPLRTTVPDPAHTLLTPRSHRVRTGRGIWGTIASRVPRAEAGGRARARDGAPPTVPTGRVGARTPGRPAWPPPLRTHEACCGWNAATSPEKLRNRIAELSCPRRRTAGCREPVSHSS
jgi:hypothetical protein